MAKVIVQKDDAVLKKLVPKFPNTDAEVIKSVLAWTKKKIGKGEERAKFEERLEKAKALPEGKERVSKINGGEIALAAFDLLTVEEKKEAPVESLLQEPMQAHVEERALDVKVKSEEELTKEADDLLLRNELAKALELYDQLISRNPMNDHALHYKGKTLMELGRLDEALNAVELSLGLRSEEAAKATKRDITMRLALREEAEKDAKIRCKQAKDWLDLEIYDSALEESESALRKSSAYLPAWLCKGQALEGLGGTARRLRLIARCSSSSTRITKMRSQGRSARRPRLRSLKRFWPRPIGFPRAGISGRPPICTTKR